MQGRLDAVVAAMVVATALGAGRAQAQVRRQEQPPPRFTIYTTGGLSLRQTPLKTFFADVLAASLRVGMPVGRVVPWVGGSVARQKLACPTGAADCSTAEQRLLGGVAYVPGGGDAGPYVGGGLGVSRYRGKEDFAHTFFLGLTFPGTYVAPTFELRAEQYRDLNEIMIVAVGLRFALGS